MSDPDDDALSWAGDDRLQAPVAPPRTAPEPRDGGAERAPAGATALVVLGLLGGVAVIETLLWVRSVFQLSIAASIDAGTGTPLEVAAFVANVAGRVLAVAAPLVWFGVVAWRVRAPTKRLAWLLLGAVLLVPWPFVLGAT